jgi:hypothetical protein
LSELFLVFHIRVKDIANAMPICGPVAQIIYKPFSQSTLRDHWAIGVHSVLESEIVIESGSRNHFDNQQ